MSRQFKSSSDLMFEKAAETDDKWLAQMATEVKATEEVASRLTMFLLDLNTTSKQYMEKAQQVLTESLSAERNAQAKADAAAILAGQRASRSVEEELERLFRDLGESSPKA